MKKTGKKLVCILLVVSLLLADSYLMKSHDITAEAAGSTQATVFTSMTNQEIIAKIGRICQQDMKKTGILASVTIAQFILESGYGKSGLTQASNNCFGIKGSTSGSNWYGSTWDGRSLYWIRTKEEFTPGTITLITAAFRSYSSVEDSIEDHSAYLRYSKNGSSKRYPGIVGETNYKKVAQIIKSGGYATSSNYVSSICRIIELYDLTQYDQGGTTVTDGTSDYSGEITGSSGEISSSSKKTTSSSSSGGTSDSSDGISGTSGTYTKKKSSSFSSGGTSGTSGTSGSSGTYSVSKGDFGTSGTSGSSSGTSGSSGLSGAAGSSVVTSGADGTFGSSVETSD